MCNLLDIALLKVRAHDAFITAIAQKPNEIRITMYQQAEVAPEKIPDLIEAFGKRLRFVPDTPPCFVYTAIEEDGLLSQLNYVVEKISEIKIPEGESRNEK